jgi:ubiquinone/menaquinone biosynthesis C-methylase UbiE
MNSSGVSHPMTRNTKLGVSNTNPVLQASIWNRVAHERKSVGLEDEWSVIHETMLDLVRVRSGTNYLDIGCGGGVAGAMAVKRGAIVYGLDVSEVMIAIARRRVPSGHFEIGDMESLPFDDASFDAFTSCNSLHFAIDPVRALREMKRVAKRGALGGICSQGEKHEMDTWPVFAVAAEFLGAKFPDPFRLSEPELLESLVEEAGLTIVGNHKTLARMVHRTLQDAWNKHRVIGPIRMAIDDAGEEPVREAVFAALHPFVRNDGSVQQKVWYHHLTVTA